MRPLRSFPLGAFALLLVLPLLVPACGSEQVGSEAGWTLNDEEPTPEQGADNAGPGTLGDPSHLVLLWAPFKRIADGVPVGSVTIPTGAGQFDYDIDWDNDGVFDDFNVTGIIIHIYRRADLDERGHVRVRIRGKFPHFDARNFPLHGQADFLGVEQWGDIQWESMNSMFEWCTNATITATDAPDLSEAEEMERMFFGAASFNAPIEHWDVSTIRSFRETFSNTKSFDQPLAAWNTSAATTMESMFAEARAFNQPLDTWDVSNVEDMSGMFRDSDVQMGPIGRWDVGNVKNMHGMFSSHPSFNEDLSRWDTGSVEVMSFMFFSAASFDGDLSGWDVSRVENMSFMFPHSNHNSDIGGWDVSNVKNMQAMFGNSKFNQNIDGWDTSSLENANGLFSYAKDFDQPLGQWDTSRVTDMTSMFEGATAFDQDIGGWDTSNVTSMHAMFGGDSDDPHAFDQDIGGWDTSRVESMAGMFEYATSFSYHLGAWDISSVVNARFFLKEAGLSTKAYDATLAGWASSPDPPRDLELHADGLTYCASAPARQRLIDEFGWTFHSDEQDCSTP